MMFLCYKIYKYVHLDIIIFFGGCGVGGLQNIVVHERVSHLKKG